MVYESGQYNRKLRAISRQSISAQQLNIFTLIRGLTLLRRVPAVAFYSVRNDFAGFAIAAFTAFRLTVINAIPNVINAARANTHQLTTV